MDEKKRGQQNQSAGEAQNSRDSGQQPDAQNVSSDQDTGQQQEAGDENFYRNRERGNMDQQSEEGGASLY